MTRVDHKRHVLPTLATLLAISAHPAGGPISSKPAFGAQAVPDTGTVAARPYRLRYRVEGAGIPTIVIGGAVASPRGFSANLRQHLRLVFLDHRGYAPSAGPVDSTQFGLDKVVDDIERARQQLGLGRVGILGHSGHGLMALEYAKTYPASVSHVIMIGTPPSRSDMRLASADRYWQETASAERKAIMEENLRRLPDERLGLLPEGDRWAARYLRNAPRIWYDPRFDASELIEGFDMDPQFFDYMWGNVFRDIDITEGLERFDRPTFLALGRYDFLVGPPSIWDPIAPKFRDLTVRVFERSGHWPQYEEAALFDAELLQWMRSRQ